MPDAAARPAPTPRATIAGLSALLVVGVLLGSSLAAAEAPTRASLAETTQRDRIAPRQFADSLKRAVRELVGDPQRPVLQPAWVAVAPSAIRLDPVPAAAAPVPGATARVSLALLDLPPPLRQA